MTEEMKKQVMKAYKAGYSIEEISAFEELPKDVVEEIVSENKGGEE